MSRIGKKPIDVPEGVQVEISGQAVKVTGPKNALALFYQPFESFSGFES